MNLISKNIFILPLLALAGCASNEPIIPQNGLEMTDIYRSALGDINLKGGVHSTEAEKICKSIELSESLESCIRKTGALLDKARLTIDSNPNNEVLDYTSYTRSAKSEIKSLFPRLPNPDLVIYVYPHLATKTRAPIPGYSTVIPLFDGVQYRLPGESLFNHK